MGGRRGPIVTDGKVLQRAAEFAASLKTNDEVTVAWQELKRRWRELVDVASVAALSQFRVGDRVWFETRRWPFRVEGVITDIGRSRVGVKPDEGVSWRVSPGLLKPVESAKSAKKGA